MKDFDFDELDRAVNSVLATKDTKSTQDGGTADDSTAQTQPTDDQAVIPVKTEATQQPEAEQAPAEPQSSAITVSEEEPKDDDSEVVTVSTSATQVEPDDSHESQSNESDDATSEHNELALLEENSDSHESIDTQETENTVEASESHESSEETETPAEKSPVDTAALAAIPVKRGRFMDVVAPSSAGDNTKKAFPTRTGVTITPSADFSSGSTEDDDKQDQPVVADPATPVVNEEVEPELGKEQSDEEKVATLDTVSSTPEQPSTDTTPFIPDVPVEKRPLNDLSEQEDTAEPENDEHDTSETSAEVTESVVASVDPTLSANVPKEFDKEIMAVESNETVGENDVTHAENSSDTEAAPAIAATTAEPHPMFDTSTLAHPSDVHGHHTSKFSWVIIGGSLFVVGAALGVLYFLYGQG